MSYPFKFNLLRILLLAVIWLIFGISAYSQESATEGKEFYVAFTYNQYNPAILQIRYAVTETCNITAQYGDGTYIDDNVEYTPGIYTKTVVNAKCYIQSAGTTNLGIKVNSTKNIALFAINQQAVSTDATTVLPTTSLGDNYSIISHEPTSSTSYANILIIAPSNGTTFTIRKPDGTIVVNNQTLSARQAYLYRLAGTNLTGYMVESNYKTAVFSTLDCGVQAPDGGCDHNFEQMWPANTAGKNYFVWNHSNSPLSTDQIRILALEDNTSVTKKEGTTTTTILLGKNQMNRFALAKSNPYVNNAITPVMITSNKPIIVNHILGYAPSLKWWSSIEQSITSTVISPFIISAINNHWLHIMIPANSKSDMIVREKRGGVTEDVALTFYTNLTNPDYIIATKHYDAGDNVLIELINPAGFIANMQGVGNSISYIFTAGAGSFNLQSYFTIGTKTTPYNDTYYSSTTEGTHTFKTTDNITIKRTVEKVFTALNWKINGIQYAIAENTNITNTLTFPASALKPGENTLSMSVRFTGALQDSVYTGKVWLCALSPGTIAASQSLWASSANPAAFTNVTAASGGTGLTYQWESSTDGTTWTSIAGATSLIYDAPALTSTTHYRRKVTSSDGCGTVYSNVVIVFIISPAVLEYTACPTAVVSMGVNALTGVTFRWYASNSSTTVLATGLTYNLTKDASALQTVWVEPEYGGVKYPRVPMYLSLASGCGETNPSGCVKDGTVIFKEDFGGNNISDPAVKLTGIPQVVGYTYNGTGIGPGTYGIRKVSSTNGSWHVFDDHTYENNTSKGYLAQFDANASSGQFYEVRIDDLCANTNLFFSIWASSVVGVTGPSISESNMIFILEDELGNIISKYYTGNIPNNDPKWKQYGFEFTIPNNISSIKLKIINNGTGTNGNDFVMDDIEIRFCAPPVITEPENDTTVCLGSKPDLQLKQNYVDDGTFGNNLDYRWEFKAKASSTWVSVSGTAGSSTNGIVTVAQSKYTISSTQVANEGYYRFVVAAKGNINSENCRAISRGFNLGLYGALSGGTIAANQSLWANNADPIAFTNVTAASGGTLTYQYQWESSTDNITWTAIAGATATTYDAPAITATTYYRRKVLSACGTAYSNVVNVLVIKSNALQYTACPNAVVSMGVNAITGVTFRWYASNSSTTVLATGLTYNLTKDASALQTLWVEPEYGGVKYPRIPMYLSLASGCGETDPSGCAKDGTILFKEDFGGNNVSDPIVSPAGIPQVVGYTYNGTAYGGGTYGIRKQSFLHPNNIWYVLDDHTFKNDITRGYMLQVDATAASGQFYKHQLDNLCSGTTLYFSAWITSAAKIPTYVDKTNMIFVLEDLGGNVISKYHTGNVPDVDPNWKQYGFSFKVPSGVSSLVLKIINNGTGTSGNDFVMDDIEIRFCAPPVITEPENDTTVCLGSKPDLQLKQNYVDDGTFGNNLDYRWEFKAKASSTWVSVSGTAGSSTNGIVTVAQSKYTISSTQVANEGDYRFVVAAKGNINSENCRAISRGFNLGLYAALNGGTIAASQSLWANADPVAFTNTTAASGGTLTYQYQWESSTDNITWTAIAGATSLTYDAPALTATTYYRRKVLSVCGTAYSNVVNVLVIKSNALQYTACPNAVVSMGVNAITGVTFRWYASNSSTTVLATGLTYNLTKDASALQTLWVEPEYGGVKYPRIPMYLSLASGCGETDPSGCAKDGTILFKEDFDSYDDGLNPVSGQFSTQGLDVGRTSYLFFPGGITANDHPTFHTVPKSGYFGVGGSGQSLTSGSVIPASPVWNEYSLMKYITGSFNISTSEFIYEHTTSNKETGRMMVVDASEEPGLFYKHEINNLCQGSNLLFSVWVNNLGNPSYPADPNLKFILTNKTDNSVVSIYQTGAIAPGNSSNKKKWLQYSFSFDLPIGVSDIIMHIENVGINTFGNDFAIDDIEIRLCAPPVIIEPRNDTTVCLDSKLDLQLKQDYADDGTFGSNLAFRWEFKATGSLSWTSLHSGTSSNGIITTTQSKHTINSVQPTNAGDYRLLIASAGNLDNVNCRANKGFALAMHSALNGGTITGVANVCYKKNTTLNLTGFSGGTGTPIYQWQNSTDGVTWTNIASATALSYTTPNLTTSTYYRCATTNTCGTVNSSALQITVTQPLFVNDVRVEICPMPDRKINLSAYIDLNNIPYLTTWSALTSGTSLLNPSGELMTAQHVMGTYKYKYKVKDHCMSDSANLYLSVVKNSFFRHDTVVICKDLAQRVSLNQAVGAEFNGVWSCSPSTVLAHISTSPEGIIILNGTNVYADPLIPFTSYHGISAKIVDVIYTPNVGGCITTPKTITYVITSDIIN